MMTESFIGPPADRRKPGHAWAFEFSEIGAWCYDSSMSSRRWFAIAAIGRDRPGIVADLSECVYACDCNLEDASMATLGNEFATLMLVSGSEPDTAQRLSEATRRLEWERHLTIFVRPLDQPLQRRAREPGAQEFHLEAVGVDKAGIVAGISRCLAQRNVEIGDLRSRVAPMVQSGTPLYTLVLRFTLPAAADRDELERALKHVAQDLDVELSVEEIDPSES